MAQYPAPDDRRGDTFNESDYLTTPEELAAAGEDNRFVRLTGSFMTGTLYTPTLQTDQLTFPDGIQDEPFTEARRESLDTVHARTRHIWVNGSERTVVDKLVVDETYYTGDGMNLQTKAFTDQRKTDLDNNTQKVTKITYDPSLLKTTVSNSLHATTFTTDSFNSSHLANTTSHVQTQLNAVNDKTANMSTYQLPGARPTTVIAGNTTTNYLNLVEGDLTFADWTVQTTAFTSDKNTVLNRIPYITMDGRFSAVSVGSGHVSDNNYDCLENCEDNIQSRLNSVSPPGCIQMYAGILPPTSNNWLMCDGRLLTIDSYPRLFAVIGYIYNIDRTPPTGTFYIPDLRGLFVKGYGGPNQPNTTYGFNQQTSSYTGQFQAQSVQHHAHDYIDRGDSSINVTRNVNETVGSSKTDVANNTEAVSRTSMPTYPTVISTEPYLDITQPSCMSLYYIICVR